MIIIKGFFYVALVLTLGVYFLSRRMLKKLGAEKTKLLAKMSDLDSASQDKELISGEQKETEKQIGLIDSRMTVFQKINKGSTYVLLIAALALVGMEIF